jgi:hypothetical protein
MRWANRALFIVNVVLAIGLGWFYLANASPSLSAVPPPGLDWKDYVSILLTIVTIVLAAVALFIAVAAIWGYAAIRQHAEEIATAAAVETATRVARAVAAREALATEQTAPEPPQEETDALAEVLMQGRNGESGEADERR